MNHEIQQHLTEEDLVLLYYSEPGPEARAPLHLRECAECRKAAKALAQTLNLCSEWSVPEACGQFERSVWAQIAPHLDEPAVKSRRRWLWLVPGLLALLICTFYVGRMSKRVEAPISAGLSDTARQRILNISLADHLDRAELLLTEISNADDSDAAYISEARYRAQDMVDEGRLMRQSLAVQGESATLALLDEIERFMQEVANAPDGIKALRQRIDSGSLLFKVRIIESNLRMEGQKS